MGGRRRRAVLAAAALLVAGLATAVPARSAAAATDGHFRGFGDAGGFLDILPPGQRGDLTPAELAQVGAATDAKDPNGYPAHVADQRAMYDALNFAKNVTVIRDKSAGVPHIFGRTRSATMFAEGYTTAEDRLLTMDVLRRIGRGTLSELVGKQGVPIDANTIADSPYTEADLQAQIDALARAGSEGRGVVADFRHYVAGVNAFIDAAKNDPDRLMPAEYKVLGATPSPWTPTDVVATAANIGAIFGRGGGHELTNFCGLATMTTALGSASRAREVFDALHFEDSPAAPTTSTQRADYPTGLGRPDPAA